MSVLLLCLLPFAMLASLPFVFFRHGRPTPGWCVTAVPFFMDGALLLAAMAGLVTPASVPAGAAAALSLAAVPLAAIAIALIAYTVGSHRVPVALWHQNDDAPAHIVTWGAYAKLRHPFYTAFIVMLAAAAAALPHAGTLALLVVGVLQLNSTAVREEQRLLASQFGAEYAEYMGRTGRFLPRRAVRTRVVSRARGTARSRPTRHAS